MNLNQFLVKAKINTYATEGEGGEKILDDNCRELIFEDAGFKYRDRYYGFDPFVGEEIVFEDNKAIWGMNYYGQITSKIIEGNLVKDFLDFLKESLRQIPEEIPFRGPKNFKNNDFEYTNQVEGNVERFVGKEKIFYKNEEIYSLDYHGGKIKFKKYER